MAKKIKKKKAKEKKEVLSPRWQAWELVNDVRDKLRQAVLVRGLGQRRRSELLRLLEECARVDGCLTGPCSS